MERTPPTEDEFLAHFAAQMEEASPDSITIDTEFRQLPGWSSMQSLIVIASFDWEFGVGMTADELKAALRVRDLYTIVKGKMH